MQRKTCVHFEARLKFAIRLCSAEKLTAVLIQNHYTKRAVNICLLRRRTLLQALIWQPAKETCKVLGS